MMHIEDIQSFYCQSYITPYKGGLGCHIELYDTLILYM